jgi:hypothetical protein
VGSFKFIERKERAVPEKNAQCLNNGSAVSVSSRLRFLTDRDLTALELVCEQGTVTLEQLWHAIWKVPGSDSKKYTYTRIQALVSAGFLCQLHVPFKRARFFTATALGRKTVQNTRHKSMPTHLPPVVEFLHTERLTDIRLALQRSGRIQHWLTDRMLVRSPNFPRDRFRSYIPDALWVSPTNARVLVEYERSHKGLPRLRRKVEAFSREMSRTDRFMDHVLWICEPERMPELKKAVGSDTRHTVRTFQEFQNELFAKGARRA